MASQRTKSHEQQTEIKTNDRSLAFEKGKSYVNWSHAGSKKMRNGGGAADPRGVAIERRKLGTVTDATNRRSVAVALERGKSTTSAPCKSVGLGEQAHVYE